MISWSLTKYVLLAAMRDRLLPALFILMGVGASLAIVTGSTAVLEPRQFSVVFMAGTLRFCAVLGLVLFVVFHIRRSFDNKDVEYLLSRPISRISFILSHALGFSILAAATGVAGTLVIYSLVPSHYSLAALMWGFSLIAELIIMVNVALFFSMVVPSATIGVLATLGLYALARLMGDLLGIIERDTIYVFMGYLNDAFECIALIIPRLDLMAQTSWLIYGSPDISWYFIALQAAAYSALVLAAASVDLSRRQF